MAKKEESTKQRKSLFGLSPRFEREVEPEEDTKPKAAPEEDIAPLQEDLLEKSQAAPTEPEQRSKPRQRKRSRKKKPQEKAPELGQEVAAEQGQEHAPVPVQESPVETRPERPIVPVKEPVQPKQERVAPSRQQERAPKQNDPDESPASTERYTPSARPGDPAPEQIRERAAEPKPESPAAPSQERPLRSRQEPPRQHGRVSEQHEQVVEPKATLPPLGWEELSPATRRACERAGWNELTPVQSRAIPYLMEGRDLMVQSRTGSGKTGAFVLPLIELLDKEGPGPQALVLVPTRELAVQVEAAAHELFGDEGLRSVAVYGGVSYGPQLEAFRKGVHLVVGTPGRILDHLLKRTLILDGLKVLIFDEADRMLSMGFYPDMQRIRKYLPARPVRGSMFSATYPPHVIRLAQEFLSSPEMLSLSHDQVHVAEIDHVFSVVPPMEKDRALVRFIELENPVSAIIFCNTKSDVHYVTVVLQRFGHNADELSSDLAQAKRGSVLEDLRSGRTRYLVATDVAARGIDIPEISHIFQYGPPEDPELYIHRAGRTGRAGASGKAVTLVSGMEKLDLQRTAQKFGIDMREVPMPTEEEVSSMVAERMVALLESRLRTRDRIQLERLRRFIPLVRELGRQEEDPLVLALLLDEIYQESLHKSPDAPLAPKPEPVRSEEPTGEEKKGKSRKRRPRRRKPAQPRSEDQAQSEAPPKKEE
jgi:ATP-dependent RNA helicase DeaD